MQEFLVVQFEWLKFNLPSFGEIEFHSAEFSAVYKDQQLTDAGKISCIYLVK